MNHSSAAQICTLFSGETTCLPCNYFGLPIFLSCLLKGVFVFFSLIKTQQRTPLRRSCSGCNAPFSVHSRTGTNDQLARAVPTSLHGLHRRILDRQTGTLRLALRRRDAFGDREPSCGRHLCLPIPTKSAANLFAADLTRQHNPAGPPNCISNHRADSPLSFFVFLRPTRFPNRAPAI